MYPKSNHVIWWGVQLKVEYPLLKTYALLNISSNILRIIYSLNMGIGGETGWSKFELAILILLCLYG